VWTRPRCWALALLIKPHNERAGMPLLPVVRGDEETRRQ
jgi:heme o synthase